jgi:hypothetical protein
MAAAIAKEELTFDIECYPNYFLIAFKSVQTQKVIMFESYNEAPLDLPLLKWVMTSFKVISFNGIHYDEPIFNIAMQGATNVQLYEATVEIIVYGRPPWQVLRSWKIKKIPINHVDLKEVCPLQGGLKTYSGRLHARRMQDLPFKPGTMLSPQQAAITRMYCVNDLDNTALLRYELREELLLRDQLTDEYKVDVRSKSDAQIAEALFRSELEALGSSHLHPSPVCPGRIHRFQDPGYLRFESELLRNTFKIILDTEFVEREEGGIGLPQHIAELDIPIGNSIYHMGLGGLHSREKKVAHRSDQFYKLFDYDVASYYPMLILNVGMYPQNIGPQFRTVYKTFVDRRLAAKAAKRTSEANSLKIVVNGAFGKLGDRFSVMYSPSQLIQTTLTGQLSLLMLIEVLENRGISVVSANTDGIVIKCPVGKEDLMREIVKWWEGQSRLEMECSPYKAFYSRDVNSYIAVKEDGTMKGIGPYKNPWADPKLAIFRFHKNPVTTVCTEAIYEFLKTGKNPNEFLRECRDIRKFIIVRKVKEGAVKIHKDKTIEYLGESIRWYYSSTYEGELIYALNGNNVPLTTGAKPCLELPDEFPDDIDYAFYEKRVEKMLREIAYSD